MTKFAKLFTKIFVLDNTFVSSHPNSKEPTAFNKTDGQGVQFAETIYEKTISRQSSTGSDSDLSPGNCCQALSAFFLKLGIISVYVTLLVSLLVSSSIKKQF